MPRLQFQIVAGASFNSLKKKMDQPTPPAFPPPSLPLPSLIPPPPPAEKELESSILPPPPSETELENLLLHLETGDSATDNKHQTKTVQNSEKEPENNHVNGVNSSNKVNNETTEQRPPSPMSRIPKETGPLQSLMTHVAGVSINKLKTKWEQPPPPTKKEYRLKTDQPLLPPPPPPRPSKERKLGIQLINNETGVSLNKIKTNQPSNPLEIKPENVLINQEAKEKTDENRGMEVKEHENPQLLNHVNGTNSNEVKMKADRPIPPPPPPRPSKEKKPVNPVFGNVNGVNFDTTNNMQTHQPPSPPPSRIPKETGPLQSLMTHVAGVSINKLKTKWEQSPPTEKELPKKPFRNHVNGVGGFNKVKVKTALPPHLESVPKKPLLNHVNNGSSFNKIKVKTDQFPPAAPLKIEPKEALPNHVNNPKVETNQPPPLDGVSQNPVLLNPVNDVVNANKIKVETGQPPTPLASEKEASNPLLNHIVLNKILSFGVLSFEDVKNFRLVCTFWHNASIDYWCKNAVVKLTPNTKTRDGISVAELENRYGNKEESSAQHKLHGKSYTSYKVKGWKPKYDPVNSMAIPPEFTFGPVVAPTVEYLHIEQCNFTQEEKFEEVVLPCLNLKELVLTGNTFMAHNREFDPEIHDDKKLKHLNKVTVDGIMTLGWNQLIAHSPNVKTLIFKQNSSYSRDTFSGFLSDHTQLLRRHRVKWPITHLDLSEATGSYAELGTLRFHEFPLQELTIQFEKIQVDQQIRPLLQGSVKTLKRLNMIRISDRIDPPSYPSVDFPCDVQLDTLTELYLWGCVVDHLDFFRFTPNLKILHMNRNNFEKRQLMAVSKTNNHNNNASTVEPSKKEKVEPFNENVDVVQCTVDCWNNLAKQPTMLMDCLEKLFLDCKLGVGSMYTLRRWLPNLRAFGIVFNNNTFHLACEEWSRLEEMWVMYGSVITDEAVSAEYFLNLKSLKKFTLDAYCNQGWFTDKAAYNGFLKMNGLRYLQVCVSKQMSVDAVNLLEKKITHVKIIRNYGNGTHADYDCCQRVAFNKERKLLYNKKD